MHDIPSAGAASERLILCVAAYFPDSYGGAERQAKILAEALGRQGVDVTLVAPTTSSTVPLVEPATFGRILRKRVRAYPNLGGRHLASFLGWTGWVIRTLGRRQWRHVPVYVFHARLHALGPALAAIRNRAPLMIKLGGGGEASEFHSLRIKKYVYGHLVERLLRSRVDLFVANSGQIAAELRMLGIEDHRIAEYPNGVALPDRGELEASMARRTGRRFLYAARLLPDKNVEVLYRGAVALAEAGAILELRLVGSGPERERLQAEQTGSPWAGCVSFPGFAADIYPEMQAADFFVCASKREGQSNALLEAMSAGVIPIVYNASGVAEVVTHGVNGFIVDEATPAAFAQAMRQALELSEVERRGLALAARDFAERNIGIAAVAERTRDALRSVAAGRRGGTGG